MAASYNPQRGITGLLLRHLGFLRCSVWPGSGGVKISLIMRNIGTVCIMRANIQSVGLQTLQLMALQRSDTRDTSSRTGTSMHTDNK
jgi:hypothetical protein